MQLQNQRFQRDSILEYVKLMSSNSNYNLSWMRNTFLTRSLESVVPLPFIIWEIYFISVKVDV
jgi:hypothetical protein